MQRETTVNRSTRTALTFQFHFCAKTKIRRTKSELSKRKGDDSVLCMLCSVHSQPKRPNGSAAKEKNRKAENIANGVKYESHKRRNVTIPESPSLCPFCRVPILLLLLLFSGPKLVCVCATLR